MLPKTQSRGKRNVLKIVTLLAKNVHFGHEEIETRTPNYFNFIFICYKTSIHPVRDSISFKGAQTLLFRDPLLKYLTVEKHTFLTKSIYLTKNWVTVRQTDHLFQK